MSDLKMAQLKLAKYEAGVDAAGFQTSFIDNTVHISNHADSPAWGRQRRLHLVRQHCGR